MKDNGLLLMFVQLTQSQTLVERIRTSLPSHYCFLGAKNIHNWKDSKFTHKCLSETINYLQDCKINGCSTAKCQNQCPKMGNWEETSVKCEMGHSRTSQKKDTKDARTKLTYCIYCTNFSLKLGMVIIIQVHILGNIYKNRRDNKYVHFTQHFTSTTII